MSYIVNIFSGCLNDLDKLILEVSSSSDALDGLGT